MGPHFQSAFAMKDLTKLNLRLPATDREDAALLAREMGLSLNAYILLAVRNANAYRAKQALKYRRPVDVLKKVVGSGSATATAAASRSVPKVGANQPCPCGSGEKYKRCHGRP